jgi:hypothetical protein
MESALPPTAICASTPHPASGNRCRSRISGSSTRRTTRSRPGSPIPTRAAIGRASTQSIIRTWICPTRCACVGKEKTSASSSISTSLCPYSLSEKLVSTWSSTLPRSSARRGTSAHSRASFHGNRKAPIRKTRTLNPCLWRQGVGSRSHQKRTLSDWSLKAAPLTCSCSTEGTNTTTVGSLCAPSFRLAQLPARSTGSSLRTPFPAGNISPSSTFPRLAITPRKRKLRSSNSTAPSAAKTRFP